jgi:hypothetical protein
MSAKSRPGLREGQDPGQPSGVTQAGPGSSDRHGLCPCQQVRDAARVPGTATRRLHRTRSAPKPSGLVIPLACNPAFRSAVGGHLPFDPLHH